MSIGERLAAELRRAWNGAPWHGPAVREILGRLSVSDATKRRFHGSHTPWQLVLHLITWADTPIRRLDDPAYDPQEDEDFPEPSATTAVQWDADIGRLADTVERLASRVERMTDDALLQSVGERGYSRMAMVDGVVQHLAYHGGQLALLARPKAEVPSLLVPAPVIPLSALLVGHLLARVAAPLRVDWPVALGAATIAAGAALTYWAHEHFVRRRTPAVPWRAPRNIVVEGPYRLTRNPMYVGFLLMQAGIGMVTHSGWTLVLLIPSWGLLHWGVVLREEEFLRRKFGEPYQQLLDATRRWL